MVFGGLSLALAAGLLLSFLGWSGWFLLRTLPTTRPGLGSGMVEVCWRTGAFLVIFGVHLGYVHHYATPIPFYDQWSAEGEALIRPYLEGTLRWGDLLAAHNEHRITTHRIWTLLLLELNGQWDNLWQTMANGLLLAYTGSLLVVALLRFCPGWAGWAASFFGVVLFVLPMGWSNAIFGFQAQFYFVQYFGLAAFFLLICGKSWTALATGWASLLLAYLSLSGAILLAMALVPVFLFRAYSEREGRCCALLNALLAMVLCGVGILLVPHVTGHQAIRPDTLARFLESLVRNLAWPWIDRHAPWWQTAWLIPLLWAPFAALLVSLVAGRSEFQKKAWRRRIVELALAFGSWSIFTVVAVAYTRGGLEAYGFSWRYNDITRFGLLANVLALIVLGGRWWSGGAFRRSGLAFAVLVFAVAWTWGLTLHNREAVNLWLPRFERFGGYQVERVSAHLRTGKDRILSEAPEFHIPYPHAPTLIELLADPHLDTVLPWSIRRPLSGAIESTAHGTFRLGAQPRSVAQRTGERIWSNYNRETGQSRRGRNVWKSDRPPSHSYLLVYLAGAPHQPNLGLYVTPPEGEPIKIWRTGPGDAWQERRFAVRTDRSVRMEAMSATESDWFAFTEPREMSAVSFYTIWLGKQHLVLAVAGMVLLLTAAGVNSASRGWRRRTALADA